MDNANGEVNQQGDPNNKFLSVQNNLKVNKSNIVTKTYGWGKFQPKFLQGLLSAKWALFWLCWAGAMQGLIVNGFVNGVITTIERRFGLRSSQTGLVASGYDIASFVCLAPVSYFGGRLGASKPRWLAWGVIIMGLGSLTFAFPHFLVGPYRASTAEIDLCTTGEGNATVRQHCEGSTESENENLTWTVWLFFASQLLHGIGAAPLYTLGVTYIDENVSRKMSSVYLGIYYTMAIIGPAVGYVVGGQLLLIYTDFMTVDSNTLGLTSQSKVWIGAWWIGFVFAAIACIVLAIPMFGYPESLPGSEEIQQERVSEAHNGNTSANKSYTKLKDIPKAFCALLRNPTFCLLNLAGASEGLIIAGFSAFLPKQIENQFSISPVWAALLMGVVTVPAGGGGTFLGGYLVKRLKLTCSGIIKLCLIVSITATFFTLCFLLSCPNLPFAGVTSAYSSQTKLLSDVDFRRVDYDLDSTCNMNCGCNKFDYDPVCGADGVMYFSPCHAGCDKELNMDGSKIYLNCECIHSSANSSYDAINTICETTCNNLGYFIAVCFMLMLFTFLATMPALSATLRCVHDDQRSFALGIQWIKVRIFGTIPAPLLFGAIIDETCILWEESCDDSGACLVYDNKYMSKYMWILALIGKICSVVFFFGAWYFYIPPKGLDDKASEEGNDAESQHQQQPNQQVIINNTKTDTVNGSVANEHEGNHTEERY